MFSVSGAQDLILSLCPPPVAESVPLAFAAGRVLLDAARADEDSPRFDCSAMDGYALRRADVGEKFRVVGAAAAGGGHAAPIGPGECVRILTGGPLPSGADWIVRQEDVDRHGDVVTVLKADRPSYIRRRGENRRRGDLVVPAGTRLGPPELAALASHGVVLPTVARAPRCLHLATGDELVDPATTPAGPQVRDSNSTLIAALLREAGADLVAQGRVRDEQVEARAWLAAAPAADILLLSGGASVGDRDIAKPLLAELGYRMHFRQVNLRPGRPFFCASHGARLAFAFPGNPVSHWVTFHLFLAPLLRKMQGLPGPLAARRPARLAADAFRPPADARETHWPARVAAGPDGPVLRPLPLASSGDGAGLAGANALWAVPPDGADTLAAGARVDFIPCP